MTDEEHAISLGFWLDGLKWRHPACPEYRGLRAKHAVEDYPSIVAQRSKLEAIRSR